jgi:hypothetical protein
MDEVSRAAARKWFVAQNNTDTRAKNLFLLCGICLMWEDQGCL